MHGFKQAHPFLKKKKKKEKQKIERPIQVNFKFQLQYLKPYNLINFHIFFSVSSDDI